MDNKHNQHSSGGNTFIFGILVGALLTLLFSTKKGRKILKTLLDEGMERFSDWEDTLKKMQVDLAEEGVLDDESVVGEAVQEEVAEIEAPKKKDLKKTKVVQKEEVVEAAVEPEPLVSEMPEEKAVQSVEDLEEAKNEEIPLHEDIIEPVKEEPTKSKAKRLFKGIRRKSS